MDLQRLTASVETMRTSVLQAYVVENLFHQFVRSIYICRYLDLHERFTKTTELQTSALTALWKKVIVEELARQNIRANILVRIRKSNSST